MPDKIRIQPKVTSRGARFKRFACVNNHAGRAWNRLPCHSFSFRLVSTSVSMIMLLVTILIAVGLFGLVFYQSYRDKRRWKRLATGKNPFRKREHADIPPLAVDGVTFDSARRPVLVIWGNLKQTGFPTVPDARAQVEKERKAGSSKADGARIFAWDGESWQQRSSPAG